MSPSQALASCAYAVPSCNDTNNGAFLTGDNAWIGMVVIAVVIAAVILAVRLRRPKR
jgi:hypothetical protein